ncbi:MAG TPA: aminopeptidase [Thiothrix sp.]|nr:aminopeptidase [Thiothrix sp.]
MRLAVLLILLSTLGLSSCSHLSYYTQGIKGHVELVNKRQAIPQLLTDNNVSPLRKKQLKEIITIRQFAKTHLALPDNGSYQSFVELGRDAVTWNIVATPKYKMVAKRWYFPIVGHLSYKGFFNQTLAKRNAQQLTHAGYDVFLAESTAYSTLGWFSDPVVSPMLKHGTILAAETIFHELAHQRLYFPSDSTFNEAFATAVGQEGTRLWLKQYHPNKLATYDAYQVKQQAFLQLLLKTSQKLQKYYTESVKKSLSDDQKEHGKQAIFQQLRHDYALLKQHWQGDSRYDTWFDKPVNNARLILIGVYHQYVADFKRHLRNHHHGDFAAFYQAMQQLRDKKPQARYAYLAQ